MFGDFFFAGVPRQVNGDLVVTGAAAIAESVTLTEMTAPGNPAADKAVIYLVDNGGSTEAYIKFHNGNSTKLADDTA